MARRQIKLVRAGVEMSAILFLFYANLLMGEFTRQAGSGKTWAYAFGDIMTVKNLLVGVVSAAIGFVGFEFLRDRL